MIRERLGNVICMVLVLSANDIPGEGTLLFLAGEIPKADRNWGPDFRGCCSKAGASRRCFPGIMSLIDIPSQHSRTERQWVAQSGKASGTQ